MPWASCPAVRRWAPRAPSASCWWRWWPPAPNRRSRPRINPSSAISRCSDARARRSRSSSSRTCSAPAAGLSRGRRSPRYASNTSTRATCASCRGTCRSPSTGTRFRPRSRHAAPANRAGAGSVWRRSRRVCRRRPATISRTGSGSVSGPSTTAASPGCSSRRSAGTPPRRGPPGSARHRRSCRDGRPGAVSATLEDAEPLALFQPKINALRRQPQQPSPGACATPRRRDPRAPRPRAPSAARHASA